MKNGRKDMKEGSRMKEGRKGRVRRKDAKEGREGVRVDSRQ
jgi:hypothetical protein